MEEMLKVFSRLKATQDGTDFVDFLIDLSKQNYRVWKKSDASMNDVCKGQALAIDSLVDLFDTCDAKLQQLSENTEPLINPYS